MENSTDVTDSPEIGVPCLVQRKRSQVSQASHDGSGSGGAPTCPADLTPRSAGPQPIPRGCPVSAGEPELRSLVIMELATVPPETTAWLLEKLSSKRRLGGCGLRVKTVPTEQGEDSIVHITATSERLLVAAELMELKKEFEDGSLREISMADIAHFKNSEDPDNLLTMAEKQLIIKHEMFMIRALEHETCVPGLPKVELYVGEAIIPRLLEEGLIEKLFPLHCKDVLKVLGQDWYRKFFSTQPLDRIQQYFGQTIAMYFAFLGFYTMALIPPAFIGVLSSFASVDSMSTIIFFSIFNTVWVTVFLETWKQNKSALAYSWGAMGQEEFEEARPQFYGVLGRNPVTDRLEPEYPKWKRMAKFYCVSLPLVFFCLYLGFLVMLLYFWLQEKCDRYYTKNPTYFGQAVLLFPTVVYAALLIIMNGGYRPLAKALNDWENHRLESGYENHLIVKLVLFDFTNSFMSLFYVAFYMQDMALLRSHLATLLITQQLIGQVREALLPYVMYKKRKNQIIAEHLANKEANGNGDTDKPDTGVEDVTEHGVSEAGHHQAMLERSKDEYEVRVHVEGDMWEYSGTLDDYLEMFLQFGYVFLFSAVFPSAAFWALLNNFTEVRSDAFKLCRIFQRPFPSSTSGIGAWQVAFEIMSVMAVVTNTALVALTPQVQEGYVPTYGKVNVILTFVIAEHAILFIKYLLSDMIPDEPEWVETALARVEYQSKQALRKEKVSVAKREFRKMTSKGNVQTPVATSTPDSISSLATLTPDSTPAVTVPGDSIADHHLTSVRFADEPVEIPSLT